MKTIDAHHHIWQLSDLTWLSGPIQPRIFGNYDPIRRDYHVSEFIEDVKSHGVVASVYIQVNWPCGKEVAEALWVHDVARNFDLPNAVIGYVDFSSENCKHIIEELAKLPLMRGIRQQLHWHRNPLYRFATRPDIMMDSAWRNNFSLLQNFDWPFELQVFASQMKNAAKLASAFPETKMILQHCGMPEDTSRNGMSLWLDGMKYLADRPNVFCKFSGLGTFLHKNSPNFISDILGQCLELFGSHRCIYGSNFPIEKIWTNYTDLIGSYRNSLSSLSQHEQNLIFYKNAKEIYKIDC